MFSSLFFPTWARASVRRGKDCCANLSHSAERASPWRICSKSGAGVGARSKGFSKTPCGLASSTFVLRSTAGRMLSRTAKSVSVPR